MNETIQGIAGEDLSSSQYLVVYADGGDSERLKVAGAAGNATVVGVLLNKPADEEVCEVCMSGFAPGIAGGALEPFDVLTTDAAGKFVPATTQDDYRLGQYVPPLENGAYVDAAAGDKIRVLLFGNKLTQTP